MSCYAIYSAERDEFVGNAADIIDCVNPHQKSNDPHFPFKVTQTSNF